MLFSGLVALAIAFWVPSWLNCDVDAISWLPVKVSDVIERRVTQVNVVDASAASACAAFAGVAGVGLWTCVSHSHHDASAVASAVSTSIVSALYLEAPAAHTCGA